MNERRDLLADALAELEASAPAPTAPSIEASRNPVSFAAMVAAVAVLVVAAVAMGTLLADRRPIGEAEPTGDPSAADSITPTAAESAGTDEWGPLAVTDFGGSEARTEGGLVVTDACVFVEFAGERWLLVWQADRTRWNSDNSITYSTNRDGEVTIRDGDYVVLGGGGSSADEDGLAGHEWAASIDWVHPPADACLVDIRWFVSNVSSIGVPSPTPGPSPAAWIPLPIEGGDTQFRNVNAVTEWNGRLVAVGSAGSPAGAIWTSDDGSRWERATIPAAPTGMGVSLRQPFAVRDSLFVFGTTFNPAGSGPIGSVLWTSSDGRTWTDTAASAQFEGAPLGLVGVDGQRVVASEGHETPAGSAFWASSDGGATWERSPYDLDSAWAMDGLVHEGRFVAVGARFEDGVGASDSTASVWTSDDGLAWERTDLGPGRAVRIAELGDGSLLIVGDDGDQPMGWTSSDARSWARSEVDLGCCGVEFVITPSGFVAVQGAADGSGSVVYASSDGLTWSAAGPLAGEMRDVTWTDPFGVVISGLDPEGRPAIIVGWESE